MDRHLSTAVRPQGRGSYRLADIDQFEPDGRPEIVPTDAGAREAYARVLATEATVYGLPAVYQYVQMYAQACDPASPAHTGFDAWLHQREVADADFTTFKTPNVDTLYSNAWLDLTDGPALVRIPPIEGRYYTLHFLDAFSNATNLSSRTVGAEGGEFLVAPPGWTGDVDEDTTVFRVASAYMWILMRILVKESAGDVELVRRLQDEVEIRPTGSIGDGDFVPATQQSVEEDWRSFFAALDWVLRANPHPVEEDAYVYRFRGIGLGGPEPLDLDALDDATQSGMAAGFADARTVIERSRAQLGEPAGDTGWMTGSAGEDGFNYLRRAVRNFVGTGGNVIAEKRFFVTHTSGSGRPLDGSQHHYVLTLETPPPVDGHWSLTLYEAATGFFHRNELDRYAIAPTMPGLELGPDGSLTVRIQHERPDGPANWLPAPRAPFYVDLRTWEPGADIREDRWQPAPIVEVD